MELLILIPALLIFLYFLYRLSGDDHIFIRKGISVEHMFDIAFTALWISVLTSRVIYFILNPGVGNGFINFFTTAGGLSLPGAFLGGIFPIVVISKLKKYPLGRVFDFFTFSLLFALPAGYVAMLLFRLSKGLMVEYLIAAVLYLVSAILFKRFLFPKLLNRTLKEGTITLFFFLIYSVLSFLLTFVNYGKEIFTYVSFANVVYLGMFILSLILLFKQERNKIRRRTS